MERNLKYFMSLDEYLDNINEMAYRSPKLINQIYTVPYKAVLPPQEKGKYDIDKVKDLLSDIADNRSKRCTIEEFENAVKYATRLNNIELAVHFIRLLIISNPALKKDDKFKEIENYFKEKYEGTWSFYKAK